MPTGIFGRLAQRLLHLALVSVQNRTFHQFARATFSVKGCIVIATAYRKDGSTWRFKFHASEETTQDCSGRTYIADVCRNIQRASVRIKTRIGPHCDSRTAKTDDSDTSVHTPGNSADDSARTGHSGPCAADATRTAVAKSSNNTTCAADYAPDNAEPAGSKYPGSSNYPYSSSNADSAYNTTHDVIGSQLTSEPDQGFHPTFECEGQTLFAFVLFDQDRSNGQGRPRDSGTFPAGKDSFPCFSPRILSGKAAWTGCFD
jgi:hypothetical protein